MSTAIVVEGAGKRFPRYQTEAPRTLRGWLLRGFDHVRPTEHFWALRDVSFSVARGEMLGIIGRNGSGKSTLLRLIGGVMLPDEGRIRTKGRLQGLLELGTGSHRDLTGRENIFVNGVIAGLTRQEIQQRFDSIVAFAELEDFIDQPLRTYSSGMKMRLGFSVAVHAEPDILLIDEILSVGDLAFQQKCLERIKKYKADGCAVVLISHDLGQVQALCDRTLWLRTGSVAACGASEIVIGQYRSEMSDETRRRMPQEMEDRITSSGSVLRAARNRFGSFEMEITEVRLLDAVGLPVAELESGDAVTIEISYDAPKPIQGPIFNVSISNTAHENCMDLSTDGERVGISRLFGKGKLYLHVDRLDLSGDSYFVSVGLFERNWTFAYDYHWQAYPFLVRSDRRSKGVLAPPRRWEIEVVELSARGGP